MPETLKYPLLYRTLAYFLPAGLLTAAAIIILRTFFSSYFTPMYYRVFFFETSLDFILGLAAVLFAVSGQVIECGKNSRFGSAGCRLIFRGMAAACVLFFAAGISVQRPGKILWENAVFRDPTELAEYAQKMRIRNDQPVLYFFHADWCFTCDDFEKFVLADPRAAPLIDGYVKLKVDVTEFEIWEEYMHEQFSLDAVPSAGLQYRNGFYLKEANLTGEHVSQILFTELLKEGLK